MPQSEFGFRQSYNHVRSLTGVGRVQMRKDGLLWETEREVFGTMQAVKRIDVSRLRECRLVFKRFGDISRLRVLSWKGGVDVFSGIA